MFAYIRKYIEEGERWCTIITRQVNSFGELKGLCKFVHDIYYKHDYITDKCGYRLDGRLLSGSTIPVVCLNPDIIGTLVLYHDEDYGLPSECVYHGEINRLRESNSIVELGMLTSSNSVLCVLNLMRYAYWHSIYSNQTLMIATINPKHESIYNRFLLFERLSEAKYYPSVGADGILIGLKIPVDYSLLKTKVKDFFLSNRSLVYSDYYLSQDEAKELFIDSGYYDEHKDDREIIDDFLNRR